MSDYIKREDAIEIIAKHDDTDGTIKVFSGRFVNGLISAIPPADVVEVVRFIDCRYWQNYHDVMVCGLTNAMMSVSDFCSYGERAEK